jgi:hypothetical protein
MVRRFVASGSLLVLSFFVLMAAATATAADPAPRPIRAGIIGLDTSHVVAFTQAINDPKATGPLADVKIVAGFPGGSPDLPDSWNRVKDYTEKLRASGVEIVPTIDELLKKVDVVLLESVDGRPHLAQAIPVIKAKKPLYIDKPMAGSLVDAIVIFRLAAKEGVPCFSCSSLRYTADYQALRSGKHPLGKVKQCTAFGPYHVEPHHPDLFWYGIHGVESLYTIMGPGCKTVRREAENKVVGAWADGRLGIYFGKDSYTAEVVGEKGSGVVGQFAGYGPMLVEVCKFFKTRKAPICPQETIELFAFMEAADKSKKLGGAEVSIAEIIAEAQKAADKKLAELK